MGAEVAERYPAARAVFEVAEVILDLPLRRLCFEGPDDVLRPTELAQPALLTAAWAIQTEVNARLQRAGVDQAVSLVAGHSLGEYTALVAAGALSFEDALRLVRRRGELMRDAAQDQPGAMAAILRLDDAVVERLCAEAPGQVVPANHNSPGQVVVSGESAAVDAVMQAAASAGGRATKLPVSGAFHSPLMAPAAEAMRAELARVHFAPPNLPIVQNVTAEPETEPDRLRHNLAEQITGSVRWTQSVQRMIAEGVDRFIEVGPGQVLTGLIRRIDRDVATLAVSDAAGVEAVAAFVGAPGVTSGGDPNAVSDDPARGARGGARND